MRREEEKGGKGRKGRGGGRGEMRGEEKEKRKRKRKEKELWAVEMQVPFTVRIALSILHLICL